MSDLEATKVISVLNEQEANMDLEIESGKDKKLWWNYLERVPTKPI